MSIIEDHAITTQVNAGVTGSIAGYLKSEKLKQFNALQSPGDRVAFLYDEQAYFPMIQGIRKGKRAHDTGMKDPVLAKALRDAGNTAFSKGDDATALDCYNQAVILAPCDTHSGEGEDLAISAANRSAVMYRQEKYGDCELAAESGYPQHLQYKLFQRHANCLCELFRFKEAQGLFERATNALAHSKLNQSQRDKLKSEMKRTSEGIKKKHGLEKALHDFLKEPKQLIPDELNIDALTVSGNRIFPALCGGLSITYNDFEGRWARADRDIQPGELIGVETPIVHYLYKERFMSNCTHCFKSVVVPVPCYGCSSIIFCSLKCRALAWTSYHRQECLDISDILSVYPNLFFVYRLVCSRDMGHHRIKTSPALDTINPKRGAEAASKNKAKDAFATDWDSSEEEDEDVDLLDGGAFLEYLSDDLINVLSLEGHDGSQTETSMLALATSSALLLHYLKQTRYFPVPGAKTELSQDEILIGRIFYRLLQVFQYNTHQISQIESWTPGTGPELRPLGCSVNPTLALFNHSCAPNTIRCNIGTKTLLIATQLIPKGTEVLDSYSVLFQVSKECFFLIFSVDQPRSERLKHLQDHYKFQCRCSACLNNWPTYNEISSPKAKPGMADKVPEVKKMFAALVRMSQQDLQSGYYDKILRMWSKFALTCGQTLEPPHKCFLQITSQIHDCYWLKHGNRVPKLKSPVYKDHVKDAQVAPEERG
eukprot:maker-scaffold408_size180710-snap-gene-0.32 protein:Tk05207 transcript:maker-scaffold408_size180710-snap-gene-0.32-mRNA-1 annotation:"hypothetical protein KGM_11275"